MQTLDEVEQQYHIDRNTALVAHHFRRAADSEWVLRVDVEDTALRLYGTRAFHAAHVEQLGKPCSICAITKFKGSITSTKWPSHSDPKQPRQIKALKKRSHKRR